ncbi:MAG: hypothetical protein J7K54_05135 [Candidatus Aenigmarchaeota archaeon]|nr:hypothetical protein [Candidatus Aenigmarchaeota archaeon]
MKKPDISISAYFLIAVIALYAVTAAAGPGLAVRALESSYTVFLRIAYIFVLIYLLTAGFNYFVSPESVKKHLGTSSGAKRWAISIAGGIISTGPIYMWYPFLRELKKGGVGYGFIATFLYNRAVKIPLLPVIIFYFGIKFTAVLTVVMILMSVVQGIIFEKFEKEGML